MAGEEASKMRACGAESNIAMLQEQVELDKLRLEEMLTREAVTVTEMQQT